MMSNNRLLPLLIFIAVIVNAVGLFSSIWGSDANSYSIIAKNIVLSHNWIDLTFAHHAWLDKPHFPFWATALSYKIFGIHAFSYILPGFLFNLIGAYYTYLIAKTLYSRETGLFAALLYLSSLSLMVASINVKAEAYLLGEIMPACYYWFCYNEKNTITISLLLKGAFFTALAMMTKGIFVLLPLFSGIGVMHCYRFGLLKTLRTFFSVKWLLAFFFSFLFILPELISLYLQFDLHPTLIVFGHTHVSGIKFFFWDSQFGRFFNTGPITQGVNHFNVGHYFYFTGVLLWAFLPWSVLFVVTLWNIKRHWISQHKIHAVYLLGSFFPAFFLFSLSKFQLDHYTNIIIPFAAIMVAQYLSTLPIKKLHNKFIVQIQAVLSIILCCVAMILSVGLCHSPVLHGLYRILFLIISLAAFIVIIYMLINLKNMTMHRALISSVISIALVFFIVIAASDAVYKTYYQRYQLEQYFKNKPSSLIVDYFPTCGLDLGFFSNHYLCADTTTNLAKINPPYYLVINKKQWSNLQADFNNKSKATAQIVKTISWTYQNNLGKKLRLLLSSQKRFESVDELIIVFIQ